MAPRARERALAYLATLVDRALDEGVERLPTVAALATGAGVSPVTMLHAVRKLRDDGVVTVSHGRGIRVIPGGGVVAPEPAPVHHSRWVDIMARIESDIVDGRHDDEGVLAAPKQMRHRYGVSHRTLKRALDRLVEVGTIEPYKRGYRVAFAGAGGRRETIALVTNDLSSFSSERFQEVFLALERESSRRGLRLRAMSTHEAAAKHTAASPLGFILWGTAYPASAVERFVQAQVDTPVAVLMEVADRERRKAVSTSRSARVFSFANSRHPGRAMGAYLRGLGHRRICYLSPIHRTPWARNRLAGLREAFESTGSKVLSVVRDHIAADDEPGGVRGKFRSAVDELRGIVPKNDPDGLLATLAHALDDSASEVGMSFGRQFLHRTLGPLFEEALGMDGVTAWVAHNDIVAFKALDFLREHGVAVPGRLSVVGFDNLPLSSSANLTSFDHNVEALCRMVLDFALGGTLWRRAHGQGGDIEVVGSVVERGTSAKSPVSR